MASNQSLRSTPGRPLGSRAKETSAKLKAALLAQIEEVPWTRLTVHSVARAAGMSPASVYQYHETIESFVMTVAEELEDAATPLGTHMAAIVSLLRMEAEMGLLTFEDRVPPAPAPRRVNDEKPKALADELKTAFPDA